MEDLIGKKIKFKGSNDIKIIKDVRGNRVYFTDNGSADHSKLFDNFELVKEQKINPDTFFNESSFTSNLGDTLLSQIEQLQKNPEEYARMAASEATYNVKPNIVGGKDISMLDPDTQRQIMERVEKDKRLAFEKEQANKNDPFMILNNFNKPQGSNHNAYNELGEQNPYNSHVNTNVNTNDVSIPATSLSKMKKTFKAKIILELNEMIPKAEDIRAVENLFDISLIDNIAKEIADKYLNDRVLFTNMITCELEKIIKPKKAKKTTVKKIDSSDNV
jgi:hypothetical protein